MSLLMTEKDADKLRSLVASSDGSKGLDEMQRLALEEEIEKATIVSRQELPADVVTMHSRVRIVDMRTGEQMGVSDRVST